MAGLQTPLTRLLPADVARKLAAHRDLRTAGDLLWFLPRRYLDLRTEVAELVPGSYAVFVGTVLSATARPMRQRRGRLLSVTVRSGEHEIDVAFFSAHGHERKLLPGASGLFAGTVGAYGGRLQLTHPAYQMLGADDPDDAQGLIPGVADQRYMPVYREVKNLPSWKIGRAVAMVLDALDPLVDPVPADILQRRGLPGLGEAFARVHAPVELRGHGRNLWPPELARLRYDEALMMQVLLARRRLAHRSSPARPRRPRPGGLLEAFDARLPFELTAGQRAVGEELSEDLARDWPMHRLLQGDVGSGKTVVALRAMLAVVDAGGQAAMLAPTEVLAAQHHRSITTMMGDLAEGGLLGGADQGTRVALLTGSQTTAQRRRALLQAASGEAGIVVGTHALIQEGVGFFDLGLAVVDEQHRFGVAQRDALRGKAQDSSAADPHVLVMTATPIPRTVAMTVFGDMDVSVLTELPAGRSPITTHVVDKPAWLARTWARVAEEVAAGHQAYVVCPRIDDDAADSQPHPADEALESPEPPDDNHEALPAARSVMELQGLLATEPSLAGLAVDILHGRLPAEAKESVMAAFTAGDIDVLISTTVIEVGVDVPNATVMVVMDAERFGVSQLHQLRGRIGRGTAPGLCLLVTRAQGPALERLHQVAATTDGFEVARIDLEQRREGDVLGARQSGRSSLRLLRLTGPEERDPYGLTRADLDRLIQEAREDAAEVVGDDPDLHRHPELAAAIGALLDDEQAAYLERG
ncbi:MAG: ATP-dependent DNA helicase RecG [Austwickia sp.]|nr:ATP-dependent DNA helicase RecG [Austwickia sp.]